MILSWRRRAPANPPTHVPTPTHACAGGPITIVELSEAEAAGGASGVSTTTLGPDPLAGHALQHVVPAGAWFGALPCEGTSYALVGCTVAPAFQFESFEFGERGALLARFPAAAALIDQLLPEGDERPG